MQYYSKEDLIENLDNTTEFVELSSDGEDSAIISKYGGRPLGLFPKEGCKTLLWISPNLQTLINKNDRGIGGDRYWISPERDFFYKDPENWKGWFCPQGLDPANYQILGHDDDSCTVSSNLVIKNQRTQKVLKGEITRQFSLINAPKKADVSHCGIKYIDDCVIYRPNLKINGWSLATVISGGVQNPGTVLIPTKQKAKPLSYFRTIPKERIHVEENYVAYKIDVDDIYKLAIRPEDIDFENKSKIGYVLDIPDSEDYGFLLKRSDDIPKSQDNCWDEARDHPDSEVGVIQSYNSESPHKPLLRYGEIELQLNSFETIANTSHGKAIHELFYFLGPKDEILGVIEEYLGISEPKFF